MLPKTVSFELSSMVLEFLLKCGDKTRDSWEECDEGNQAKGDGCNGLCEIESTYVCILKPPGTADHCEVCGDSKNMFGGSTENCDDGNRNDGDGCSKDCAVESLWTCKDGSSSSKDTCSDKCGDGKVVNRVGNF